MVVRQREEKAKVFCIGFHKTGTSSMAAALTRLGYRVAGPFGTRDPDIRETAAGRAMKLVPEFDAFQDNPWAVLYRHLDAHFPGSRFILTIRDPQRWIRSAVSHFGRDHRYMREWIYGVGYPEGNELIYLERFARHNREVLAYFSGRDDLLVMNLEAGDGWAELCPFLGHDVVPPEAFPHANRGAGRQGRPHA